ncbi:MAG: chorismate synthase [FCB group bacterium]|nr:chorismate synthase [FCB group bacterium]
MFQKLKFLTAGESHGKGLSGILEGIPAGLEISEDYISAQLARRQKGHGRGGRMKIEKDWAEIYSGVRHGKTLGSPVSLILPNRDWENWRTKMSVEPDTSQTKKITLPRPGHADLAGVEKYGFDDIRNVLERSSARETAMRVALGSICRKLLNEFDIYVGSRVIQILDIMDNSPIPLKMSPVILNEKADASSVRVLDKTAEERMQKAIDLAGEKGDSVGGVFEVIATGLPYGLGSYVHWDRKLNTRLAAAVMSINAIKGVEIGAGFDSSERTGSDFQDEITFSQGTYARRSNHAGGIEGGMSNAQPVLVKAVMKPIPTLRKPLASVDIVTKEELLAHKERTDVCAVPAASIVAESMVCLVLADALLEKFGGDSVYQLKKHMAQTARY